MRWRNCRVDNGALPSLLLPVITNCDPEDYLLFDQDLYVRSRAAQFQGRTYIQRDMARVRSLEVLQTGDPRRRVPNSLFEMLAEINQLNAQLTYERRERKRLEKEAAERKNMVGFGNPCQWVQYQGSPGEGEHRPGQATQSPIQAVLRRRTPAK